MWSKKKKQRAINTIFTFGGAHRSWLIRGGLGTIGVVFCRLAMPWPLRGVIEVVFPRGHEDGKLLVDFLPSWWEPVFWLAGIYLLLAFILGISEFIQRVNIMRFAAQTVHDMRAAAVKGAKSLSSFERASSGDLISRIIGDSARIKAGLSGIVVHGLQNGLLFVAVCAVMLYISLHLGLIFLLAGVIALWIGLSTSTPVAKTASKQRRKEGDYAAALQEGLEHGGQDLLMKEINWSSARKEVRTTKIIALSSLYVHVVLAAAVGVALWFGTYGVRAGFIAPGDLFIFIAYALTVHRRMVQVGRQAARTGKVLACANRLSVFIKKADLHHASTSSTTSGVSLESGLRFERVKLSSSLGRGAKARLRRMDLVIQPRSHVAVLGNIGAGKSSLLRLLAGVEFPDKGKIFWDDEDVTIGDTDLSSRVAYLSHDPVFPPTKVWKILGLSGPDALTPEQQEILQRIEAWKLIQGFPKGLRTRVGSISISRNEARILRLSGIILGDTSSVWVLDNPVRGFSRKKARRCLEEILTRASDRTVVIAMSEPIHLDGFDRVLFLQRGKILFEGTPADLKEWKRDKKQHKNYHV